MVPSTFQDHAGGNEDNEDWTWRSHLDQSHQIDFVGLPVEWADLVLGARVLKDVPLTMMTHEDRRAVLVAVRAPGWEPRARRKPWYNRLGITLEPFASPWCQAESHEAWNLPAS